MFASVSKAESLVFNQVFQRKNLVIKMNVGAHRGKVVGRAGINNLFHEHNSSTVRNILMIHVLSRLIEQVSAECRVQECTAFPASAA